MAGIASLRNAMNTRWRRAAAVMAALAVAPLAAALAGLPLRGGFTVTSSNG